MPKVSHPKLPDMPVSHLPFSPVVRVDNMLYVSGQASVDDNGSLIEGSFEEEFNRSMQNLERILIAAGSSLANIVQTRCYVDNSEDLPEFNRRYAAAFKAPYPARTTILQCFNGVLKFEIDCIATVETSI